MSDRYNPLGVQGLVTPQSFGGIGTPQFNLLDGELTDYQKELQPVMQAGEDRELAERNKIQPLRKILDLLQRGQYVSANIARGLLRGDTMKDLLSAAWSGLTGKEKTSYEDVIREFAKGWGEKKLFKNAPEGTWRSQVDNAKVFGFIGDILLDPTTYVGFGASKGAQAAAKSYADDVVRVMTKEIGERTAEKGAIAATKGDIGKILDKAYREAYAKSLRMSGDALRGELGQRVGQLSDVSRGGLGDLVQRLEQAGTYGRAGESAWNLGLFGAGQAAPKVREGYNSGMRTMGSLIKKIPGSAKLSDAWWSLMNRGPIGKVRELVNIRNPYQKYLRQQELQAARDFGEAAQAKYAREAMEMLRDVPEEVQQQAVLLYGEGYARTRSRAAIEALETSKAPPPSTWGGDVGGDLARRREADRIQGRYQLPQKLPDTPLQQRPWGSDIPGAASRNREASRIPGRSEFPEELPRTRTGPAPDQGPNIGVSLRQRYLKAEGGFDPEIPGLPTSVDALLNDPSVVERLGITDVEKLRELVPKLREYFEPMHKEMEGWVDKGYINSVGEITDYLPMAVKNPTGGKPGPAGVRSRFTQKRQMTLAEHAEEDINTWMVLYGVGREEAEDMIKKTGYSSMNMNLQELLLSRGIAQAKMQTRVNIIEQFKEFGIPINEMGEKAQRAFIHKSVDRPEIGLRTINAPGFQDMLFDYEVAKVAEHALNMTSPRNVTEVGRLFQKFTAFWKGVVTMTTGFHLRNFYSNEITLFMKQGSQALNPRKMTDAFAGVVYALNKGNLKKAAADIGMEEGVLARALNHRYGNFSIRELADEAMQRNVISSQVMGEDAETILESVGAKMTANPLSKNFAGRRASRKVGEYVENQARFQSFIMDYADTSVGQMGEAAVDIASKTKFDEEALQYASLEAKKWFLDYGDLSDFEQTTLKQVVPFYSWLRKNIANQVQAVALYPELFSLAPKIEELFTYEHPDYDPSLIPPWMKQMGMFPTGQLEDGTFRMFNPNFPYQDLNKIPLVWEEDSWFPKLDFSEAKDDIMGATHPLIQSALSLATEKGYDLFYRTELGEQGDAPYLMRLLASNPGIIGLVDGIQRSRGAESPMQLDENGKLQINARTAQLLEKNMPLLRWFEFLFYLPEAVIPGLENIVETTTNAQDDYEGVEETMQLMSYYLGIKFSPADLEEEKMRIGRDLYYRARDVVNEERRDRPGYEMRSMQSRNETDQLIRRLLRG